MSEHTPGLIYECKKCGWSGEVNGRQRCLSCSAQRTKEWRAANPAMAKAQKIRNISRKPAEYFSTRKRVRRANNPETAKAAYRRRIDWLKSGDVQKSDLESIYHAHNGLCAYCQSEVNARFTPNDPRGFDHVVPRAKGGMHTASNIVVCCKACNERKSDNG